MKRIQLYIPIIMDITAIVLPILSTFYSEIEKLLLNIKIFNLRIFMFLKNYDIEFIMVLISPFIMAAAFIAWINFLNNSDIPFGAKIAFGLVLGAVHILPLFVIMMLL